MCSILIAVESERQDVVNVESIYLLKIVLDRQRQEN